MEFGPFMDIHSMFGFFRSQHSFAQTPTAKVGTLESETPESVWTRPF